MSLLPNGKTSKKQEKGHININRERAIYSCSWTPHQMHQWWVMIIMEMSINISNNKQLDKRGPSTHRNPNTRIHKWAQTPQSHRHTQTWTPTLFALSFWQQQRRMEQQICSGSEDKQDVLYVKCSSCSWTPSLQRSPVGSKAWKKCSFCWRSSRSAAAGATLPPAGRTRSPDWNKRLRVRATPTVLRQCVNK